ncbi:alpha/beta hydrolase family protein [Algiphilus sp.]|uniref:alpha/beta hydrolase family protein n=1 Tax=Algiphilus sp. TaxID=1872431 RepID=UPI003B52FE7B
MTSMAPWWLGAVALCAGGLAGAQQAPTSPEYPSQAWFEREADNYARTLEGPTEQVGQSAFVTRLTQQSLANIADFSARAAADPSWLLASSEAVRNLLNQLDAPQVALAELDALLRTLAEDPAAAAQFSLNTPITPLCASYALQCAGDPFRYPGVDAFYGSEGLREPVVFYDRGCARISGHVWQPVETAGRLPSVVIENGSIQAPEPLYWWFAQRLVRAGYTVMTFDPRGQGRSDQQTPDFEQGSNANSTVFWNGLVDAIDFFRSTPQRPYPHNEACAGTYPTPTTPHNPYFAVQDRDRLGLAGHSLGATGVAVVQSYGAPGAEPWPGVLDASNPVDAVVAWDGLPTPAPASEGRPAVVPRVPAMGQTSEYGIFGGPHTEPPDPESHKGGFEGWRAAGVPVSQFTIRGSTHFEWSNIPTFPSTSWCPDAASGRCSGGWGLPMAEHYSLAWLDRWLKRPGEPGHTDADARLLDDAQWADRFSFYYRSARDFPTRGGAPARCEDVAAGCSNEAAQAAGVAATNATDGGGAVSPWSLLLALMAGVTGAIARRLRAIPG